MSDATERSLKQDLKVFALDLRRIDKNGIRASFTVYFPALDLRVKECLWGQKAGCQEWVNLPSRSWVDNDGATRHVRNITFGSFRSDKAFQTAALAAVHELDARTP
jgi:hypothetical protein